MCHRLSASTLPSFLKFASGSSSKTKDIEEGNPWKYLGFGWLKDDEQTAKRDPLAPLNVTITPKDFKEFMSSATSNMKTDIFKDEEVDVLSDFTEGQEEPFDAMEVRLHFEFNYVLDVQNQGNLIKKIVLTNKSATQVLILSSMFGIEAEYLYPSTYVSSTITPYSLFTYGHEAGIDIEVNYRWEEIKTLDLNDEENPIQVLHLRLTQEPVPNPVGVVLPIGDDIGWIYLGTKYIDDFCQTNNRLEFKEATTEFILNSFPLGRITDRVRYGKAIRVWNAITPADTFCGLQIKVDLQSKDAPILVLLLGPVLKYNPDFVDNKIKVHYRWRREFLELLMQIEPCHKEQAQPQPGDFSFGFEDTSPCQFEMDGLD